MGRGPSSLNWVTFVIVLALAAGGYAVYQFGGHYWTAWMVDKALADAGGRCYKIARLGGPLKESQLLELETELKNRFATQLKIADPELEVRVWIDNEVAHTTATWKVVVRHPKVNKETVLRFARRVKTDVKAVQW